MTLVRDWLTEEERIPAGRIAERLINVPLDSDPGTGGGNRDIRIMSASRVPKPPDRRARRGLGSHRPKRNEMI